MPITLRRFSGIIPAILLISSLHAQTGAWFIDTIAGTDRPVNDGGRGTAGLLNSPGSVVVDAAGNVIFADTNNHRVRQITPAGTISTIFGTGEPGYSGDGGPASAAQVISPQGIALDSQGNLYVSDYAANVIRKVTGDGVVSTIAGTGFPGNSGNGGKALAASMNGPYALAFDKSGNLYVAEDINNSVRRITPDGTMQQFTTSRLSNPEGLAVDASGNVYIASWADGKIVKATPSGAITVFAGNGNYAFSGDGGAATGAALAGPQGLAFDAAGNLWICDGDNNRIRRISPDGIITTVIGSGTPGISGFSADPKAASLYTPTGIAIDAKGIVY